MPNVGLPDITMEEDSFFQVANDGMLISIDLNSSIIEVDGERFGFKLSQMEIEIFQFGGIASALGLFGKRLFEAISPAKFPPRTQREIVQKDKLFEW